MGLLSGDIKTLDQDAKDIIDYALTQFEALLNRQREALVNEIKSLKIDIDLKGGLS
jgi:hypothetical protein